MLFDCGSRFYARKKTSTRLGRIAPTPCHLRNFLKYCSHRQSLQVLLVSISTPDYGFIEYRLASAPRHSQHLDSLLVIALTSYRELARILCSALLQSSGVGSTEDHPAMQPPNRSPGPHLSPCPTSRFLPACSRGCIRHAP